MIGTIAVALVVGTALALAITFLLPPLRRWLDDRRMNEPVRSHAVATDSAVEAEKERLADRNAELAAAETSLAERERQIAAKLDELTAAQRERIEAGLELARQEAILAERERTLEESQAEAERSAAEARAEIEAHEAALANQGAGPQEQEGEPTDAPQPSAAERDLIWWEKQLGGPRSTEK